MPHHDDELTSEHDPERCRRRTPNGQCDSKSVLGSDFCNAHGGRAEGERYLKNQYALSKVREDSLTDVSRAASLSLREEVAVATKLLEARLELVAAEGGGIDQFIANAPAIQTILLTLEKMKLSAAKLDSQQGNVMSKDMVMLLMQAWIGIVSAVLKEQGVSDYEEMIPVMTDRMIAAANQMSEDK